MAQGIAICILVLMGIGLLKVLSPTGKATDAVKIGGAVVGIGIGIVLFWGLAILVIVLLIAAASGAFN